MDIQALQLEITGCRICVDRPDGECLPHKPRPVVVMSETARLCICGQAPGTRVHASGIPFDDRSGDRLRDWMGIGKVDFYNPAKLAIVPMGFCFPGLDKHGGDLPPRKECREKWHGQVFDAMRQLELVLVIGMYAKAWHLPELKKTSVTDTVRGWRELLESERSPKVLPLPHPSWRNTGWFKKNPWFEAELLPRLRDLVHEYI